MVQRKAMISVTRAPRLLALLATGGALAAQGLLGLPASDPAGIARSGAGIAYGRSLEAASLNPALLVTLPGKGAFFLSGGQEFQSGQDTLESNQQTFFSTDRNRLLPAFGAGWVLGRRLALGLKVDTPFLRHGKFGPGTSTRFLGDEANLVVRRAEAQVAFALREDFSLGLGVGVARIDYASGASLRVGVPADPTRPLGAGNLPLGLMEQQVRQEGTATVPSASFGLRWAVNPRWTLALAFQGPLEGDVKLKAEFGDRSQGYVATDGLSPAPLGIATQGAALRALSAPVAGRERLKLPLRAALGLRHRATNLFTWEVDLRYTDGEGIELPGPVGLATPSGTTFSPAGTYEGQPAVGVSLMGELALGKDWTVRGGLSIDQGLREDARLEPLWGGARAAAFSAGVAYRLWKGELSLGYQVRQAQDVDTRSLDGVWSITGYRATGTNSRIENSGHLYALGYKVAF